jgi:hypothetical protein
MRKALLSLLLLVPGALLAQEGFPLDGTWRGEVVNKDGSHRTIVLVMQYDGKQVNGTLNPGPDSVDFTGGKLTPEGWKFAVAFKGNKGLSTQFNGTISNLGKYNRVLAGKWTEGANSFDIRFVHE